MKKLALFVPILAAVALLAQPAFADDTHRHEKCAHMAHGEAAGPAKKMSDPESTMQESLEKMRAQMAEINQTKDSKKRRKLLQEHNQSMRDSIKIMRDMMGGMAMGHTMGDGHKMCDHKMDGHKMGDHKMDGNSVSQPGSKADAAPAAQAKPGSVAATDKTSASPEKKLWVCPMHPDVVRDQPGTCPICGMDLVEMDQTGTSQPDHGHTMGGCMKGDCMKGGHMMGGAMKDGCMMEGSMKGCCMKEGGMEGGHMMGGAMKGGCMMEGGMKCDCMKEGGMMGGHMMGEAMKGGCMMEGGMKGDCMKGGGMKCQMMEMTGNHNHMGMMLMLMEQMVEHNEAEMAIRK